MNRKQIFSIRKTTLGVASVAIASLVFGMSIAQAQEVVVSEASAEVAVISPVEEQPILEDIIDAPVVEELVSEVAEPATSVENITEETVIASEEASVIEPTTVAEELITPSAESSTVVVPETFSAEPTVATTAVVAPLETAVKINEVESSDPNSGPDWIEIYNTSDVAVDISGWRVADDKGMERLTEPGVSIPLAEGTMIEAGGFYVFKEETDFTFGLGKEDIVQLYNQFNELMDTFKWTGHASGTYGRSTDGTGEFTELTVPTPNTTNQVVNEVDPIVDENNPNEIEMLIINEVDSSPADWIELLNNGPEAIDITGYELRDDSDDHRFKLSTNPIVDAGGFYVIDNDTIGLVYDNVTDSYLTDKFSIGLGSSDRVRLYNPLGDLIDEFIWTSHAIFNGDNALATYGRIDGNKEAIVLTEPTMGETNVQIVPSIAINEVESNDPAGGIDWVEVINYGKTAIDIKGWFVVDDGGMNRVESKEVTPIEVSTIIDPGGFFVFENGKQFTFGLGKADQVSLIDQFGMVIDFYAWTAHAEGTYGRIPNGTGEFIDLDTITKNAMNSELNPVLISEVESKDENDGFDWIEFYNPLLESLDISGLTIKDNDDAHQYTIPNGTIIDANQFWMIDESIFGFGLGKADSVRIFDGETLIQEYSWTTHADNTYALRPDTLVMDQSSKATPVAENQFADIPTLAAWDGPQTVVLDGNNLQNFLEDSSGLDFHEGALYAVDNGTATVWKLNVSKEDGSLVVDPAWVGGKKVQFLKDLGNDLAKGPDAEGITLDKDGFIYIASERDNADKNTNYNTIIKVNPNPDTTAYLETMKEWNLTALLPSVSANMGIEAVEWVSNQEMVNIMDLNTNALFDPTLYPNMTAQGIFFVALEDNGVVYGFVLNEDGTAQKVAEIDSKIGGAMALDYDTHSKLLYVSADDGYNNMLATIGFNGTETPVVSHISKPEGLVVANREGFAIATADYTKDGLRPVYWFEDGVKEGALMVGALNTVLTEQSNPVEEEKPTEENVEKETPTNPITVVKDQPKQTQTEMVNAVKEVQKASVELNLPETGEQKLPLVLMAFVLTTSGVLLLKKK